VRDGQVAGAGDLAGTDSQEIVSLMVGRSIEELFPTVPHVPGAVLLSVDDLSGARQPRDAAFEVRRGEILGIAGLVGSGRTELLRCLFGLDAARRGTVRIAELQPAASPRARIAAGLALVSEDRKGEGLAQARSIGDNLTYSRLEPYARFGCLNLRRRRAAVAAWMARLQVKARSSEQAVHELSGGNQQKIALARVMHQEAEVYLLDEPTRGIDVGTKAEIYRLMGQLAAEGKAIIFVSSYFTELLAVCDRIAVMSRGCVRDIRPSRDWTEESLMRHAVRSGDESLLSIG
jgi:ribose transport system ATP-binding protein